MKKIILVFLVLVTLSVARASEQKINDSWYFHLGDMPEAKEIEFNHSAWQEVRLPHDWAFEKGYSQYADQKDKGGYAYGGIGWYRKVLTLDAKEIENITHFLDFEAVYMNSEVWVNGEYLGKRPYGYISFSYDVTKHLHVGDNVISVRVDNSLEPSARWYHGCGIYGNVSLRSEGLSYFEKDATFVTTPSDGLPTGEVSFSTTVISRGGETGCSIDWSVENMQGDVVAKSISKIELQEGENDILDNLKVNDFKLWDTSSLELYTLKGVLKDIKGRTLANVTQRFGFRTVEWSPEMGFLLNGKQMKINGVCEHLEGGPTGAIWTEKLIRWKLQLLKDMGCNAVRVAHNPQLPLFYDICDEMGMLVMDELFDGWHKKADFDYGMQSFDEWWERDTRAWIRRNRNHPSIIIYSIGNETRGDEIGAAIVEVCHEEDSTRLVTSGHSASDFMDVLGMNGHSEKLSFLNGYEVDSRAFVATENPHTWQVRGFYRTQTWYRDGYPNIKQETQHIENLTPKEIFAYDWTSPKERKNRKQVFNSSYDNATVRVTARHLLEITRNNDWLSGYFRWTGFDYFGEAGYVHGGWPFRIFQSGALDVAGFQKDLYYLYQSEWSDKDMVHILPHWTHPVMEQGTEIPVWVYTSGDEVELFINGKSLGRQAKGKSWNEMQCSWMVPYYSGELEAVAYRKGKEIARTSIATSGVPSQLKIEVDNCDLKADNEDVSIVMLTQTDSKGELYPYGENRQYVHLKGDARVLSMESGSPVDSDKNFGVNSRRAFFGLNRVFVQSTSHENTPVSMLVASISGDKKLMLGDEISLTAQWVTLRGGSDNEEVDIYYTTDGQDPTQKSEKYTTPFKIELGTTVRAIVCQGSEVLIEMQERFAEDEGLYWGVAGEPTCAFTGDQAEYATLKNAHKLKKNGDSFYGDGYVIPEPNKGEVTWYQENDGAQMSSTIMIRYSLDNEGESAVMELYNNDTKISEIEFKPTGSIASHWSERMVPITIYSGANNITLKSVSERVPSIDQITLVQ